MTDELPKPLIPIFQKPLITFAIDHLAAVGINKFVVNTHRHPKLFEDFFHGSDYATHSVRLVHEPLLLETGGGIKNAEKYLGSDSFLTYSGDILTDVSLQPLIEEHLRRGNDVTLALRDTGLASHVAVRDHRVVDIANRYGVPGNLDFANIAVWNSAIFKRIPPQKKISFIPIVTKWIGEGGKIGGLVMNDGNWFNIGSRTEYLNCIASSSGIIKPHYVAIDHWPQRVAESATVDATAKLRGCSVVGEHCRVGAKTILDDTICGRSQKLLPKRSFRVVLSAPKKASGIHRDIDI